MKQQTHMIHGSRGGPWSVGSSMEGSHPLGTALPLYWGPTPTPKAGTPRWLKDGTWGSLRCCLDWGPGQRPCGALLAAVALDPQHPLTNKSATQRLLSSSPSSSIELELEVGYIWCFS